VQSPQFTGLPTQNWGYSKIYLNPNAFAAIDAGLLQTNGQTAYQVKLGTVTHEFGHAMGLAHYSNAYVIMCQMSAGRKIYQPSADDCNGINSLY
jgi:predicted Zn-dependent protease